MDGERRDRSKRQRNDLDGFAPANDAAINTAPAAVAQATPGAANDNNAAINTAPAAAAQATPGVANNNNDAALAGQPAGLGTGVNNGAPAARDADPLAGMRLALDAAELAWRRIDATDPVHNRPLDGTFDASESVRQFFDATQVARDEWRGSGYSPDI